MRSEEVPGAVAAAAVPVAGLGERDGGFEGSDGEAAVHAVLDADHRLIFISRVEYGNFTGV